LAEEKHKADFEERRILFEENEIRQYIIPENQIMMMGDVKAMEYWETRKGRSCDKNVIGRDDGRWSFDNGDGGNKGGDCNIGGGNCGDDNSGVD
jgi:hypothetical protein